MLLQLVNTGRATKKWTYIINCAIKKQIKSKVTINYLRLFVKIYRFFTNFVANLLYCATI